MNLRIQKKADRDTRVNISLDNICWGTLPAKVLQSFYPIPFEDEISEIAAEEIKAMILESARTQVLDYLAKFERSEYQTRQYLQKYHYHKSIIQELINDARERSYLDDVRYSELLVRSLCDRQKSKNYIINKLYEQHIPAHIYEAQLAEYLNKDDLKQSVKTEISKLLLRYQKLSPRESKEKIFASLYRKGFDLDLIRSVYLEISSEAEEE